MSFASGIGSLQQTISSSAAPDTKLVGQVGRSGSVSPISVSPTNEGSFESADNLDQATLSSTGGVVAQALEGSDTRDAKIASLQQAIATGSYSVSSSDVADKIIQSLLE
jgi:negative regulator of flagellin synthesis FlgM